MRGTRTGYAAFRLAGPCACRRSHVEAEGAGTAAALAGPALAAFSNPIPSNSQLPSATPHVPERRFTQPNAACIGAGRAAAGGRRRRCACKELAYGASANGSACACLLTGPANGVGGAYPVAVHMAPLLALPSRAQMERQPA